MKEKDAILDASKEAGLELNLEKSKYILMSRTQNMGQKRS
jgi:hypothetical protein